MLPNRMPKASRLMIMFSLLTLMGITSPWVPQAAAADRHTVAPETAEGISLVPITSSLQMVDGEMELTRQSRIVATDKRLAPLVVILADEIFLATGLRLETTAKPARPGDIALVLASADAKAREDAHRLVVAENATVSAASYRGVALGTVTLLQALQLGSDRTWLPHMVVEDGPRFSYNGILLDLARKPYLIATLKQCIEVCRFYKIRHVLLHMSDENAWTFPSTKYPQLGSNNFAWGGGETPRVYKLDELQDLVAFADARGVTLVPELEVPGHSGLVKDGFALINAPWGCEKPYFDPFLVNGAQLKRDEPLLFGTTSLLWESESEKAVPYLRFTGALRNEPTWNPDSGRDFGDFLRRLQVTDRRLDRLLYGFAFTSSGIVDPALLKSLDPLFAEPMTLTLKGLTDGYVSRESNFLSLEWLGFEYRPFEATVDLGEIQPIKTVGANFLQLVVGGIFIPSAVEISVSDDGATFREVGKVTRPPDNRPRYLYTFSTDLKDVRGRYVKVVGRPVGSWLFVDEIFINPEQQ